MNKLIFLLNVLLLTLNACDAPPDYSKDKPIGGYAITEGLFVESYRTYAGGVYGGDTHTVYLTDKASFRKYLGYRDDHEHISVFPLHIKSHVLVCKIARPLNSYRVVKTEIYEIAALKEEGKWE